MPASPSHSWPVTFPVYETYPGSCGYLLPLDLSLLPGAQPLRQLDQPFVRVGLTAENNCDFAQRLARAIAPTVESLRLPVRDGAAVYPDALAERDPCQVLSVLGTEVKRWDVARSRPYDCTFGIMRGKEALSVRYSCPCSRRTTTWRPRAGSTANATVSSCSSTRCTARRWRSSVLRCSAGGSAAGFFVGTGEVVIRPAVVVASGGEHCDVVTDLAVAAAKLYT